LWQLGEMYRSRNLLRKHLRALTNTLRELAGANPIERQGGLTAEQLDGYRVALDTLEGLPREW
jgi:hypothetical protein